MADKVRVGFVGAGNLANSIHYPCLASLPDVELVATCDLVEEKARETAERFSIPQVFTDYEEMLAEVDPQVVYCIMMPQDLFAPAATVLQQGRHLFVEKPLGMNSKQAQMLAYVDAATQSYIKTGGGVHDVYDSREFATKEGVSGDDTSVNWMGFWHEDRHFIDCVKEGRQPSTHFADAVKSMELVEHIYRVGT